MNRKYTPEAEAWLRANYGHGDVHDTLDAFEECFGWRPTEQGVYQKAHKLGLVKRRRSDERGKRVERTERWTCEPEMDAWMREHDKGHSIAAVQDAFEREFGFRLVRTQVSQWRARNGVRSKVGHGGHVPSPIGTERDSGKGYVLVKVRERATVPLSKDNWRLKHHLVWEQANGRPVPEGHEVVFADRDHSNFEPGNLVAVDKSLVGIINVQALPYWDAESLQVAVARARLMSKARAVASGGTGVCGVCGAEFERTGPQAGYPKPVQTCPSCLAAGRKSRGTPKRTYRRVCAVCRSEFDAHRRDQRRCPACIARAPKHSWSKQLEREGGAA